MHLMTNDANENIFFSIAFDKVWIEIEVVIRKLTFRLEFSTFSRWNLLKFNMGIFVLCPNQEKKKYLMSKNMFQQSMHAGIALHWRQISFDAMLVHKKEVFSL